MKNNANPINQINHNKYYFKINRTKIIIATLILMVLISLSYVFLIHTKLFTQGTGCIFKKALHLYCPGCGGTKALRNLVAGHIIKSILYNPLVVYLLYMLVFNYLKNIFLYIKYKECISYLNTHFIWGFLIITVGFFIVRNLLLILFGIDYPGELHQFFVHPSAT